MPRLTASSSSVRPVHAATARLLWQWLVLGALAVALLPAARGDSLLLGSLPFWLLAAPAAALLALHRQALAAAWRAPKNRGQSTISRRWKRAANRRIRRELVL